MKRFLLIVLLFSAPAYSQERARRLWVAGEIAYAATAPVAATQRPFGNLIFGLTLEQELPCRLSLATGYKIRHYNACIAASDLRTRTSWEYDGIGYSREYRMIPLLLRWQLPVVTWDSKYTVQPGKNKLYVMPHGGVNFHFGRDGSFFGEVEAAQEAVKMHTYPRNFFTDGEIGFSLGFDGMGLLRLEAFVAYTFHPGRSIDLSLREPYAARRIYSRYNTLQGGFRIGICLIDWKRTAADRMAARARTVAAKQMKKRKR